MRSVIGFLKGRFAEKETIEWAAGLGASEIVKRQAIMHWLDREDGTNLREPWHSAWRLIEESWRQPTITDDTWGKHVIRQRLQAGDRSEALVSALVDLVAPRLAIEPHPPVARQFHKFPKRPRTLHDMYHATLASAEIINPNFLKLQAVTEGEFLVSLASRLDAAVTRGLDIAKRIGWEERQHLSLHRVYYVSECDSDNDRHEPDAHRQGIAPSVKLLYAVVSRLSEIDCSAAHSLVCRWRQAHSSFHLRLWAAISRDPRITPAAEVSEFFLKLDQEVFWDTRYYPEIAELRARRFGDLDDSAQMALIKKMRKGPTRGFWRKGTPAQYIEEVRLNWTVRELRRLELAGITLPRRDKNWLDANVNQFPELARMDAIDEKHVWNVQDIRPVPDHSFDFQQGIDRLKALERVLSSRSHRPGDDPASRAYAWLSEGDNPAQVLEDIESSRDGGADFPRVWGNFTWAHLPPTEQERKTREARQVLRYLAILPTDTLSSAIEGITYWLYSWRKEIVVQPHWSNIWLRAWPSAVETTNVDHVPEQRNKLDIKVWFSTDGPRHLDALNPPTGKLIDVFLAACPNLSENPRPFETASDLRAVRNHIVSAPGRSGLIGKHRLIEDLGYFLHADHEWTQEHLIRPLRSDNEDALALWRAVSFGRPSTEVLKIIGEDMITRTNDRRLDRDTRRSLAFRLVVESLHALREQRQPAVESGRLQQMIRSLNDDEVRISCADAIRLFLIQVSSPESQEPEPPSREDLFRSVAKPFLQNVWPRERSLTSPGLSHTLARIPAIACGEFAEAVDTVERFLVPIRCWSLSDYELNGIENNAPKLAIIDEDAKAEALLRLLDRTIETTPDAVIPRDLGDALAQVRQVAAYLARIPSYLRLEAAARRATW